MKDLDLKNIWQSDRRQARDHFDSLQDPEKLARKQSKNILQRIRRNMLYETIISSILVFAFSYLFYQWKAFIFWAFLGVCLIVLLISIGVYGRVLKNLQQVNTKNVKDALEEYVYYVGRYIRRLKLIINYLTPFGYVLGLFLSGFSDINEESLTTFLLELGIAGLFGLPIIIFATRIINKRYIHWLYGRHYDALKETAVGLNANGNTSPSKAI